LYTGEPVKIWYLYAWFFTNVLIYYLYSSGMPLMYLFGIIFFSVNYLVYKFLFFYWNQTSFGWDSELSLIAISMIKWAVLIHLVMALFMFSNKRLMTPAGYGPTDFYKPKGENAGIFFKRRFDNTQTIFVLVTMIVFVAIYLFWRTIVKSILWLLDIKKGRKDIDKDDDDGGGDEEAQLFKQMVTADSSDEIYREMSIECLKDHYVRANKEFEQFRTMINALSYDEEKLSEEQAKFLKKSLKGRIQMIEDVVDIHLNQVHGLERFMEKSYMYKIEVLIANIDLLREANPRIIRLMDKMQSYNIMDAEAFHKHKNIVNRIDREMLELDFLELEMPVVC
jgi:hypothetical protein